MERFSQHFLLELSEEERAIVKNNDLGFESPVNFVDTAKNRASVKEPSLGTMLTRAPKLIYKFIERELPNHPTFNPVMAFYHFKVGIIPPWLVNWTMNIQRPTRLANSTLFFRAIHLIELFRCYVHNVSMPDVVAQDDAGDEPPAMPLEVVLSQGELEQLQAAEHEEEQEQLEPVQLEEEAEPERWNPEEKGKGPGKGKRSSPRE